MSIKSILKPFVPKALRAQRNSSWEFLFDEGGDVRADILEKYDFSGDLLDFLVSNKTNIVHKWHHYIPIYDQYFSRWRGKKVRFLEIGVSGGGSLQVWRRYFGEDAIIFGIDIDERCRQYDGQAAQVRIGSQDDPAFLQSVVAEMGGVDVVLDDGSHVMKHVHASLEYLFPVLEMGGTYMIEDLHTAYWPAFGGGYSSRANFFRYASEIVADMHRWYHDEAMLHPTISKDCSGVHLHDSIVVLDKNPTYRPVHSEIA